MSGPPPGYNDAVMRRLILFVLTLGLGAVAYSLLRAGCGDAPGSEAPPGAGGGDAPPAGGRCAARTRSGSRCTRQAEPGSGYCWQHGG